MIRVDKVFLKIPSISDLHYRQEWMKDPVTMAYNAGYELNVSGYDKQTGTITKKMYNSRENLNE